MSYDNFLINTKSPEELLKFMDNIKYGFVDREGKPYDGNSNEWLEKCSVQLGRDIFKTKHGTCWDQVELERDWFDKHNYKFKTIFMIFSVKKQNNYPTHAFLIYERGKKWFWFEHSSLKHNGIHQFNSLEELLEDVKDKQLAHAIDIGVATANDRKLLKVYEYIKPSSKLNVIDYIDHVMDGKEIL
jgi:hypothetical protein